jgi:hypothetical protein
LRRRRLVKDRALVPTREKRPLGNVTELSADEALLVRASAFGPELLPAMESQIAPHPLHATTIGSRDMRVQVTTSRNRLPTGSGPERGGINPKSDNE